MFAFVRNRTTTSPCWKSTSFYNRTQTSTYRKSVYVYNRTPKSISWMSASDCASNSGMLDLVSMHMNHAFVDNVGHMAYVFIM